MRTRALLGGVFRPASLPSPPRLLLRRRRKPLNSFLAPLLRGVRGSALTSGFSQLVIIGSDMDCMLVRTMHLATADNPADDVLSSLTCPWRALLPLLLAVLLPALLRLRVLPACRLPARDLD